MSGLPLVIYRTRRFSYFVPFSFSSGSGLTPLLEVAQVTY